MRAVPGEHNGRLRRTVSAHALDALVADKDVSRVRLPVHEKPVRERARPLRREPREPVVLPRRLNALDDRGKSAARGAFDAQRFACLHPARRDRDLALPLRKRRIGVGEDAH